VLDKSNRTIGYVKSNGDVRNASNRTIGYAKGINKEHTAAFFFFFFYDDRENLN
jgi:hypothetical protein